MTATVRSVPPVEREPSLQRLAKAEERSDITGRLVFRRETALDAGAGALELPAQVLETGWYSWRIQAGGDTRSGSLLRW
mgnify:CR=1 FL=1